MSKDNLSTAIKAAASSHGMTLAEFARELSVSENSFRSWVRRNTYPRNVLAKLAPLLNARSVDDLQSRYSLQPAALSRKTTQPELERRLDEATGLAETPGSLLDAFAILDRRIEVVFRNQAEFGQDVQRLFTRMDTDDLFVFCSLDEPPYEMEDGFAKVSPAVRTAIKRGAYFAYLYPSPTLLKSLSQWVRVPHEESFPELFVNYQKNLAATGALRIEDVKEHVHKIPVECPAFMTPQHRYVIFIPKLDRASYRVFARFPAGTRGNDRALHVPLVAGASGPFYRFVCQVLQDHPQLKKFVL
jgi:transcriptional regulator with XRE-family HTH domain